MMAELTKPVEPLKITDPILNIDSLYLCYGNKEALHNISLAIPRKQVTAFIGPSGCGKSTLLRCFNRMNDLIEGIHVIGTIKLDGEDINASDIDVIQLRRRVGMVFQKSNPFPRSIFDNVAYGLRVNNLTRSREEMNARVEESLRQAASFRLLRTRSRP